MVYEEELKLNETNKELMNLPPEALDDPAQGIGSSQLLKALVVFAVAAGAVTALIQLAPAPTFDEFMF